MKKAAFLASLLLFLGTTWAIQAANALPESLNFTPAVFDLNRFMGKWYEVAVASTCPHYLQRKKQNAAIVPLQLQRENSESNFTITASTVGNTSCKETSTVYNLTKIPGRFFHHVARLSADVESIVVRTDYEEYALMFQQSTEKPSGNKTIILKLYNRVVVTRPAVLEDFKTLMRRRGINEDALVINEYRGECVPDEQGKDPTTGPQVAASQK